MVVVCFEGAEYLLRLVRILLMNPTPLPNVIMTDKCASSKSCCAMGGGRSEQDGSAETAMRGDGEGTSAERPLEAHLNPIWMDDNDTPRIPSAS